MCNLAFVPFRYIGEFCLFWSSPSMSFTKNLESECLKLEWTHKDPIKSNNLLLTGLPKTKPYDYKLCLVAPLILTGLVLWPHPWTALFLLVKNLPLMSKFGSTCQKSDQLGSQVMQNNQQWPWTQKNSVLPRKKTLWMTAPLIHSHSKGDGVLGSLVDWPCETTNNLYWVPCFLGEASENLAFCGRIHPTSVFGILYFGFPTY